MNLNKIQNTTIKSSQFTIQHIYHHLLCICIRLNIQEYISGGWFVTGGPIKSGGLHRFSKKIAEGSNKAHMKLHKIGLISLTSIKVKVKNKLA